MKCLIDTNYRSTIFRFNSSSKSNRKEYKLILRKIQVVHNSVSLVEFGRGLEPSNQILSELKKLLQNKNTLVPSLKAWRISLSLINELYQNHYHLPKDHLRKMQMDALLAGIAIEHRLLLLTKDKDFFTLKTLGSGKLLQIKNISFD